MAGYNLQRSADYNKQKIIYWKYCRTELSKGLDNQWSEVKTWYISTFTLRHIVTECDMILTIFLNFWKRLSKTFKMQPSKHVFFISDERARKARKC